MESLYHCNTCNKNYKSYQTLWKHNKRFHTQNIINLPTFYHQKDDVLSSNYHHLSSSENTIKKKKTDRTICNYCNNEYSCYKNLFRHEKACKFNPVNSVVNDTDITHQILSILNKQKVNKKTIKDINNLLSKMNTNNNTNNTNNGIINNNTINNTINNNYNIIQLGKEDLSNILSKKEKLEILNKKYGSVVKLIEMAHFNPKYPQLHSIILTNYKTNTLYLYDETAKIFKITNKEEAITDLIAYKVCDIEDFYNEYKDVLEDNVKKTIETIIEDR